MYFSAPDTQGHGLCAVHAVWFAVRGQSMVAMADFNDSGVVSGTVTFSQVRGAWGDGGQGGEVTILMLWKASSP